MHSTSSTWHSLDLLEHRLHIRLRQFLPKCQVHVLNGFVKIQIWDRVNCATFNTTVFENQSFQVRFLMFVLVFLVVVVVVELGGAGSDEALTTMCLSTPLQTCT